MSTSAGNDARDPASDTGQEAECGQIFAMGEQFVRESGGEIDKTGLGHALLVRLAMGFTRQ